MPDDIVVTAPRYVSPYIAEFLLSRLFQMQAISENPEWGLEGLQGVDSQELALSYTLADLKLRIADEAARTHYEIAYVVLMLPDGRIIVLGPFTQNDESRVTIRLPQADARYLKAIIHNYPTTMSGIPDVTNRAPSLGDWERFDILSGAITAAGGNATTLQEYIVGPDNQMRVYDGSSPRDGTETSPI